LFTFWSRLPGLGILVVRKIHEGEESDSNSWPLDVGHSIDLEDFELSVVFRLSRITDFFLKRTMSRD